MRFELRSQGSESNALPVPVAVAASGYDLVVYLG